MADERRADYRGRPRSVYETADKDNLIRILARGDRVEVEDVTDEHVRIKTTRFETKPDGSIEPVSASGFIVPFLRPRRRRGQGRRVHRRDPWRGRPLLSGLVEIQEAETHPLEYKRFFMRPRRVDLNALVKQPKASTSLLPTATRSEVFTRIRCYSTQRRLSGWWSPGFTTAPMRMRTLSAT